MQSDLFKDSLAFKFFSNKPLNCVFFFTDSSHATIMKRSLTSRRVNNIIEIIKKIKIKNNVIVLCDPDSITNMINKNEYDTFREITSIYTYLVCDLLNDRSFYGSRIKLIPDHYIIDPFFHDYKTVQINKHRIPFVNKINICFFRGANTGENNVENVLTNKRIKCALMVKNNPKFDVKFTWLSLFTNEKMNELGLPIIPRVPESDYCKYKYCLSIDGFVSAWERPAQIMLAGSVLVMQHSFTQFFYDKLIDGHNYIRINDDFSNLIDKINFLEENQDISEKIAENGYQLALKLFNYNGLINEIKNAVETD